MAPARRPLPHIRLNCGSVDELRERLLALQATAENKLQELGLPRDVWRRALEVEVGLWGHSSFWNFWGARAQGESGIEHVPKYSLTSLFKTRTLGPWRHPKDTRPATPAQLAAVTAAMVEVALRHLNDPAVTFHIGRALEQYHLLRVFPDRAAVAARLGDLEAIYDKRQQQRRGTRGGTRGAGKSKRPHTELIRRAVTALSEIKQPVSATTVGLLLKSGWEKLALEWGDPLRDIVDVRVSGNGPIEIEYTAKWALVHKKDRFVRLDSAALKKQIGRAAR